jgi:hypothetical protein
MSRIASAAYEAAKAAQAESERATHAFKKHIGSGSNVRALLVCPAT